jgi:hypothetical protein
MYVPRTEFVSYICAAVPKEIDKLLSMRALLAIGVAHWSSHSCRFLDANVRYRPYSGRAIWAALLRLLFAVHNGTFCRLRE